MTRKQRNWAFWILVFSLNLIPLVAQGDGDKDKKDDKAKSGNVQNGKVIRKTSASTAPAKKEADTPPSPTPAAPVVKVEGTEHDLSLAEVKASIMDFDSRIEGANPNNKARLLGRIFKDCADQLEITHVTQAPGCGNNAAFRLHDKGGYTKCMAGHKDDKGSWDLCVEDSSSPKSCVFVGDLSNGAAKFDLSALGKVDIQLVHKNPNGSEDHQNVCEDFTTALHHLDQASITAKIAADAANVRAQQSAVAHSQLRCRASTEEGLQIKLNACDMLVSLGEYESKDQCVKDQRLEKAGIIILSNKASRAPLDQLDEVTDSLISWANEHPNDCSKAVEPLHIIAKRLATQQISRHRDSDKSPLDGYDAAIETLQNAIDGSSCLSDNAKLAEMQENLQINRTEKVCEMSGYYSQECQSDYLTLMQGVQENLGDNCTSWEMDVACTSATREFKSASALPQMAMQANQRQAASQASMCQVLARSTNGMALPDSCAPYVGYANMVGGYGMGGMSMMPGTMGGMPGMMGPMGVSTFGYNGSARGSYGLGPL